MRNSAKKININLFYYTAIITMVLWSVFFFVKSASAGEIVVVSQEVSSSSPIQNLLGQDWKMFAQYFYSSSTITSIDLALQKNVDTCTQDITFCVDTDVYTSFPPTPYSNCITKTANWLTNNVGRYNAGRTTVNLDFNDFGITETEQLYYLYATTTADIGSLEMYFMGSNANAYAPAGYTYTYPFSINDAETKTNLTTLDLWFKIYASGQECGNGTLESPEECDDANLVNYDGCSSICELEDYTYNPYSIVWQPIGSFIPEWATIGYIESYTTSSVSDVGSKATGNYFENRVYGTSMIFNGVSFVATGLYTNQSGYLLMTIFDENRNILEQHISTEVLEQGTSSQTMIFYLNTPMSLEYTEGIYLMVSAYENTLTGAHIQTYRPYTDIATIRMWWYWDYLKYDGQWRMDGCSGGDNTCNNRADVYMNITNMNLLYGDYVPDFVDTEYFRINYPFEIINNTYGVQCTSEPYFPFQIQYNTQVANTYYQIYAGKYPSLGASTTTVSHINNISVLDSDGDGYFLLPSTFTATTSIEKWNILVRVFIAPMNLEEGNFFYNAWNYDFLLYCAVDSSLPNPYIIPSVVSSSWVFRAIEDNFKNKFPFAYLFDIKNIFSGVLGTMNQIPEVAFDFKFDGTTTSTIAFISSSTPYQFVSQDFWSVLKLIIRAFLWLAMVYYIYNRLRHLDFPDV